MGAVPNIGFMSSAGRCVVRGGCQKGQLAGKGLNTSYWGLVGNKGIDYVGVSGLNLGRGPYVGMYGGLRGDLQGMYITLVQGLYRDYIPSLPMNPQKGLLRVGPRLTEPSQHSPCCRNRAFQ